MAAGKPVTSSGVESDAFPALYLTDNNTATRWSSNYADNAWFIIDLGNTFQINQIILNWEAAFGRRYDILISSDGQNYTHLLNQSNGAGGVETLNFNPVAAKYIKFQGIERALPYGYSLWEVSVMGNTAD